MFLGGAYILLRAQLATMATYDAAKLFGDGMPKYYLEASFQLV